MIPPSSLLMLIIELRGAPFTLLAAMRAIDQAVTVRTLAKQSGYSQPTVRTGLALLRRYGYTVKNKSGGWILTETAYVIFTNLGKVDLAGSQLEVQPASVQAKTSWPAQKSAGLSQGITWTDWVAGPVNQADISGQHENIFPNLTSAGTGEKNFFQSETPSEPENKNIFLEVANFLPVKFKS